MIPKTNRGGIQKMTCLIFFRMIKINSKLAIGKDSTEAAIAQLVEH